ncbi:CAP domain-containing protein [Actinopolymorpha sp. NPDC004070]|uniref:CAP domain-containing protein n=1 Tax=Actinopolymorpha sp. NPDC004070 TaxID=3154548 RepID=UPI0033AB1958
MARDERDVLHHDDGRDHGHWDEEEDQPRHRGRRPLSRRLMVPALVATGVLALGGGAVSLAGYLQPDDPTPQAGGRERVVADAPRGADTSRRAAEAPAAKPTPTPSKPVKARPAATPERTVTPKSAARAEKPAAPEPRRGEAAGNPEPKAAEKAGQPRSEPDSPRPRRTTLRTREPAPPAHTAKPDTNSGSTTTSRESSYEDQVVRLTNEARARAGCAPLRVDDRLRSVAHAHSYDMAARGYFGHDTPDGRTPWDRIRAAGYAYPAAENIARGQQTPHDVTQAWLNSQGHRENMLNCRIKAIGVGVHIGSGGPWWTQDFGYN